MSCRVVLDRKFFRRSIASLLLVSFAFSSAPVRGAEEYEAFLNGMRARKYFDVALEYLDLMRNSALLSDVQRQMITYEEAQTFLEMSRDVKDPTDREKALDGARDRFQKFVTDNPNHPQAPGAETQLGAVLVERGRNKTEQGLLPANEASKEKFMVEARAFFDEAEKVFTAAEEKFKKQYDSYPRFMVPTDPKVAERERVKNDLIKAHLFHATGLYEKSRTYAEKSPDRKKALETAAKKYGDIYKDYRTLIAGLTARLKEGQCYQELGDNKRSLGLYNDLLTQPDDIKPLRPYKANAMYLSLQCWTADSEKMYELACVQADEFLKNSSPDELNQPAWLAVRYYGALAHQLRSKEFPADAKGDEAKARDQSLETAQDYAEIVANITCDYQDQARTLLRELTGGADPSKGPRSFLDAQNRGTDAYQKFSAALAEANKLAATNDPALPEKQKEVDDSRQSAITYFSQALELADEKTTLEEKANVRSYICYLLYTEGKFYDAAVIGQFLLEKYPNSGGARQSAMIALASYAAEYQNNQNALMADAAPGGQKPVVINPEFDRAQMFAVATKITKQWKGDKEADDAWNVLLEIAINEQNVAEILNALANLQEAWPGRAGAEMRAGRAMWVRYGQQLGLDEGAPGKLPAAEFQDLIVKANGILEKAIERQRPLLTGPELMQVDQAETQMFLCESRIALGQGAKALECIDDPKIGLMAVVRALGTNADATAIGKAPPDIDGAKPADRIRLESVKLALQAYVLNNKIAEAQKLTEELGTLLGGAAGDTKARLAGTYLDLALRLERQVAQQRETKNLAALKETSKGFAFFLSEIAKSGDAFQGEAKFQNLNWVSDNYFKLGVDLLAEDRTLAVSYLDASAKLDAETLTALAVGDALTYVKLRQARSLRRAEKFDDAIAALRDILKDKRFLIEAQVEAAETLMDKAASTKNPDFYTEAIMGRDPDEKNDNIVWGWSRIAFTISRTPQFSSSEDPANKEFTRLYHLGRYQTALCYLLQADLTANPDDKLKRYRAVLFTIDQTESSRPDLGGEEWKPKYQDLRDKAGKNVPAS